MAGVTGGLLINLRAAASDCDGCALRAFTKWDFGELLFRNADCEGRCRSRDCYDGTSG